jgi:hypothetical protein
VPDWAQAGLSELIKGNEASLCQMLDAKNLSEDNIKEKLVEVCGNIAVYAHIQAR